MSDVRLLPERLSDKVNKFNQEISRHLESQSLNPFSGQFSRSPSPRPVGKDEYGKPLAGSLTEVRGKRAHSQISKEILELCEIILDLGEYNKKQKQRHIQLDDEDDEEVPDDGTIIVTFGELFQMYTKISNKVVGLLLAAKKKGLLFFEGEMLFQRRDDNVLIALIKPIEEIREILRSSISSAPSSDKGEQTIS